MTPQKDETAQETSGENRHPAGLWLDTSDIALISPSPLLNCPSLLQRRSPSFTRSTFPPVSTPTSRGRKTNPFSPERFAVNAHHNAEKNTKVSEHGRSGKFVKELNF